MNDDAERLAALVAERDAIEARLGTLRVEQAAAAFDLAVTRAACEESAADVAESRETVARLRAGLLRMTCTFTTTTPMV